MHGARRLCTVGRKTVAPAKAGAQVGIAESRDGGASWTYLGTADIGLPDALGGRDATHRAPEVLRADDGTYHMFLTVVPGVFTDWNHPRRIVHLTSTDLRSWRNAREIPQASSRVIDAAVARLPGGGWRMWYNNERDHKSIYYADSPDLLNWSGRGKVVADQAGEGPKVFRWRGAWWMITDVWRGGLAVYRSQDAVNCTRQPDNLLQQPGKGRDDGVIGGHADVVVSGDGPGCSTSPILAAPACTAAPAAARMAPNSARSSLQVTELILSGDTLRVERDAPTRMALDGG